MNPTNRRTAATGSKASSALTAALLESNPRPPCLEPLEAEAIERKLPQVTIFTGAATACDGSRLRIAAPAAAVAVLEHTAKRRTLVEQFDEANVREAAIAAIALGLEELKRPCRVRVVTRCVEIVWVMTGYIRSSAYYDQMIRLRRAIRRGGHEVEWTEPASGYDQTLCAIAYDAAYRIANLHAPEDRLLNELAEETTTLAARAKETGRAPAPHKERGFSLFLWMKRVYGYAQHLRNQFTSHHNQHSPERDEKDETQNSIDHVAHAAAHSAQHNANHLHS